MAHRLVVLVGGGQLRNRPGLDGPFNPIEPSRMMAQVLERAAEDAGRPELCREADFIGCVQPLSWGYEDLPGRVAEHLGAKPAAGVETGTGGEAPVQLLNDVAGLIQAGEVRIALLAGAEAWHSRRRAKQEGVSLDRWAPGGRELRRGGEGMRPLANELEMRHGLAAPVHMYPLYENALRAEAGRSIEEHQIYLSELMLRFSEVAARNPYSWFPETRSAEEIRTISEKNRAICFPYPKLMNAIMMVDQAAGLIVMSAAEADRLGISARGRVAYLGGAKAVDAWTPSERVDFVSSPAYKAAAERALSQAQLEVDDLDLLDLYSCFPSAPQFALKALGLPADSPRGVTVTGGLAHHGGPGNNYSMHSLVNMAERLRSGDARVGWVSAMGMIATKHSICVLSTDPGRIAAADGGSSVVELPAEQCTGPELADAPEGKGRIEAYTVEFDRANQPTRSMIVVRLEDGRRTVANGEATPSAFARLLESEGVGLRGRVLPGKDGAPNRFVCGDVG